MAAFLEEHKGEPELIVEAELLAGYAKEVAAALAAGQELLEARQAVSSAHLHPRLLDMFANFWRDAIMRPVMKPISIAGMDQLVRQSIATARTLLPPTMALPSDSVFEVAMLALLARIKDYTR